MYNFLTKNGQALAFGLGILITVIFLVMVVSNMGEFTTLSEEEQDQTSIFNFGLIGGIALAIFAAIAMLVFGIIQIFSNLRGSFKGLIGVGILLVIFFLFYSMTSAEPTAYIQGAIDKFESSGAVFSDDTLKGIGGGIGTTVTLIVLAFVVAAIAEVINFFK